MLLIVVVVVVVVMASGDALLLEEMVRCVGRKNAVEESDGTSGLKLSLLLPSVLRASTLVTRQSWRPSHHLISFGSTTGGSTGVGDGTALSTSCCS